MTYPKLFAFVAVTLFSIIAMMALFKKRSPHEHSPAYVGGVSMSIALDNERRLVQARNTSTADSSGALSAEARRPNATSDSHASKIVIDASSHNGMQKSQVVPLTKHMPTQPKPTTDVAVPERLHQEPLAAKQAQSLLPEANRIAELFNRGEPKLPFVETIVYNSSVPWHKGRPAWLADYASYYETSRHFIARSLNGKPDYLRQEVNNGDRFNVFRKDKDIAFYLLVDLSRQKMWFYALDQQLGQRTLLKTYVVGLGRPDATKASGYLTPVGKYLLGSRVAIYQPKVEGFHKGKRVEMMRIFGARWIPFEKELEHCSEPAKGFGLHGLPWNADADGTLHEDGSSLGGYESDGCIRLADADIKELFAIVLTKPTTIEIVKDFYQASLPGSEKH